jgi:hypothetical protein
MHDDFMMVQRLHADQTRPYSQAGASWGLVAPARFFGGTGCWARLADGSWDVVVPVVVEQGATGPIAVYGDIRRPCRLPGR